MRLTLSGAKLNRCPMPAKFIELHTADKTDAAKVQKDCMARMLTPTSADQYEAVGDLIETKFIVDQLHDVIRIQVAPTGTEIKDNDYINAYLQSTFGEYTAFIKQWLAVFAYTNYRRLPLLAFQGETSSGKSTFAEFIADFYPTLSMQWDGKRDNFSPQAEQKLLIIDENEGTGSVKQYKALKHYLGAEMLTVNLKHRQAFTVRNNINLVVTSNGAIPIFVQPEEMDENPARNKFFVYEFKRPEKVNANIKYELRDRVGYYIKTELKEIYEAIRDEMAKYRFAIQVPVTKELLILTAANESPSISLFVELIYHIIQDSTIGSDREALMDRHVITNNGLRKAYKNLTDSNLPDKFFRDWKYQLRDEKLIESQTQVFKVGGKAARGNLINWQKFSDKFCEGVKSPEDLIGAQSPGETNVLPF